MRAGSMPRSVSLLIKFIVGSPKPAERKACFRVVLTGFLTPHQSRRRPPGNMMMPPDAQSNEDLMEHSGRAAIGDTSGYSEVVEAGIPLIIAAQMAQAASVKWTPSVVISGLRTPSDDKIGLRSMIEILRTAASLEMALLAAVIFTAFDLSEIYGISVMTVLW
jgi:hypothetical protein